MISVLWVAIPFTLFPLAEQHITSALTGLLNGSLPIFAAAIGALMLRRWPSRPHAIGLGVGFVGIALIALPAAGKGSSEMLGVSMVLLAVVCYGVAVNVATPLTQRYGALPAMARMLALASIWTAPFGLWGLSRSSFAWNAFAAVLALGALGTGLAFVLMGTLRRGWRDPGSVPRSTWCPWSRWCWAPCSWTSRSTRSRSWGSRLVLTGAFLASRKDAARAR